MTQGEEFSSYLYGLIFGSGLQTSAAMSSELRQNESSSQTPPVRENQSGPQHQSEPMRGDRPQILPLSDSEERNRYHHFHREWVARTYGVQAINLPPQHFFQDPTYPPYLRNVGMSVLGMYIENNSYLLLHLQKKNIFTKIYLEHISLQETFTYTKN